MPENRVRHRNRLMRQLKEWGHRLTVSNVRCEAPSGNRFRDRLIWAVGRRGKTILIYPITQPHDPVPLSVCEEMEEANLNGALVGCALNIGDCWDLCIDDEAEYPRKERTFSWSKWLEKHRNKGESHHGSQEE